MSAHSSHNMVALVKLHDRVFGVVLTSVSLEHELWSRMRIQMEGLVWTELDASEWSGPEPPPEAAQLSGPLPMLLPAKTKP